MHLKKIPHVSYTYSVDVGGETFQPCVLLGILLSVKHQQVEIWGVSKKKIDALNTVGALNRAVAKQIANPGPNIDIFINDLTAMVTGDTDLYRLWKERYAERWHTGVLAR